jgi:hypothetical protein
MLKRLGALVIMGVGATLVGLGASGNAAADVYDIPPVPAPEPVLEESDSILVDGDSWSPPPLPDLPWDAPLPPPAGGFRIGQDTSLNPQPLPPRPDFGDSVTLNPQPLPPGPERGRRVGLNPQPLPPGPDLRLPFLKLPGLLGR